MTLIAKDIGNIVQQIRAEELNGRTPIQWLLEVSTTVGPFKTPLLLTNTALGASKYRVSV
jgi:hypothetical protein